MLMPALVSSMPMPAYVRPIYWYFLGPFFTWWGSVRCWSWQSQGPQDLVVHVLELPDTALADADLGDDEIPWDLSDTAPADVNLGDGEVPWDMIFHILHLPDTAPADTDLSNGELPWDVLFMSWT
jgi:hypothetical protein